MQHLKGWIGALAAIVLSVFVVSTMGCGPEMPTDVGGGSDYDGFFDLEELPDDEEGLCQAACERIYTPRSEDGCQQSFGTRSERECVDDCVHDDLFHDTERCVATSAECRDSAQELVNACDGPYFEPGDLPDHDDEEGMCQAACERIYAPVGENGCQQSFSLEEGGTKSEDACVDACLEDDLMENGERCVATAEQCQESAEALVEACSEGSVVEPPTACEDVYPWEREEAEMEEEVLELVNDLRAESTTCPGTGSTNPPASPLEMDEKLRCAARLHSLDMAQRGYFDHVTPDGVGPGERISDAGYDWNTMGENIAMGQPTPEEVVDAWLGSTDGHCENMLSSDFDDIGVGLYDNYWTQKFGAQGDADVGW